jgi:uroporphyrinogen-III decarboxylase
MNRRERLMATLQGRTVDRPPVSFYELNGVDEQPDNPDPFNIYSDPSWRPLIDLTRDRTDRIVMRRVTIDGVLPDPVAYLARQTVTETPESRVTVKTIQAGDRTLTSRTRRDREVNTVWTVEPLLKDVEDLKAFLTLTPPAFDGTPDISSVLDTEAELGDSGIVMIDTPDPLCLAASLFGMGEFTVVALTEPALFHRLLEHFTRFLYAKTAAIAEALPGRLWRIYGPEYASPPYLPPRTFHDYVNQYDQPMVDSIQRWGGFARIHSHGNLHAILDHIAAMDPDGLDPIEPPPQGDVQLRDVRERYGKDMVLFGNLEVSDIENLPAPQFADRVKQALEEGTKGQGRGFVLMPSACPFGRSLPALTLKNYETIVELVDRT